MAVPSTAADLSTTAGSNSPAGSESIGTSLDDYLRAIQAILKAENSKGSDTASANSVTLPSAGKYFVITGTTTINSFADSGSWTGRTVYLKFSDALQLTHSSGLILPGAANITTAAGDVFGFNNESAGVWRCIFAQRATGKAVIASAVGDITGLGTGVATALAINVGSAGAFITSTSQAIIQEVEATPIATVVTVNAAIPNDDTIPQNTEGVEVITKAITPTNASNRLLIEADISNFGMSNGGYWQIALFQDTTANALTAGGGYVPAATVIGGQAKLKYEMAAGTTSATTFKIRMGCATGSLYVNGDNAGNRIFGGVASARLRISEIKA